MPIYANNKRANYDFAITDTLVCGLQLESTEVKSVRQNNASLKGSYCTFRAGELWLTGAHIGEYSNANINHDTYRDRKLLLTKKQLQNAKAQRQQGQQIVPIKLQSDGSFIKLLVGFGRAKKQHDKRQTLRKKDDQRRTEQAANRAQKQR